MRFDSKFIKLREEVGARHTHEVRVNFSHNCGYSVEYGRIAKQERFGPFDVEFQNIYMFDTRFRHKAVQRSNLDHDGLSLGISAIET